MDIEERIVIEPETPQVRIDVLDDYLKYCESEKIEVPAEHVIESLRIGDSNLCKLESTTENMERIKRVIDSLSSAVANNASTGYGDAFDKFCVSRGRQRPTNKQIKWLNLDPHVGVKDIRLDSENPLLYRAYVTFLSRGGHRNV